MNLKEIPNEQLAILWQVSDGNPLLKREIEIELRSRIISNRNFSKEHFFEVCKIKGHAITVTFIPTSEAFNEYGQHITLDVELNEDEFKEQLKNYSSQPPIETSGMVRGKLLVKGNLTLDQEIKLLQKGFHTKDVLETISV